jgi:hypothetical protein
MQASVLRLLLLLLLTVVTSSSSSRQQQQCSETAAHLLAWLLPATLIIPNHNDCVADMKN